MTHTEPATAASAGRTVPSQSNYPARPYHKWGSMEIAQYANLRDGKMYLGAKPKHGIKTALLISAIILGAVCWIDPAGAFDGTVCQTTEGRC